MTDLSEQYGRETQRVLLSFMVSDPTAFTQSRTIIQDKYFDDELRPAVRYILEYADQYKTLPIPAQIKASTGVAVEKFEGSEPQHTKWYLETVEGFCRHRALESAVLDGGKLLDEGNYGEVERRVKEALTISLVTDIGTDYFLNPQERHARLKDKSNQVSTGWRSLDARLYGGFERGALNIFAGGSGSGKSLFLQNLALNWAYAGMNVLYVSLELSEDLVSLRLDAMVTGESTKDVFRRSDELATKIGIKGKASGKLYVKKLPEGGTTVNEIRALAKEIEIQTGQKIDALLVDYLDLLYPTDKRINPSDLFVKDKYTSEELRGLASELGVMCATASQLNRQSVDAAEFDHSHIAGGISKINTADNLFAILATASMKENGEIVLQFLKTRSSDAVGQKIKLRYEANCMRISDMPDGMEEMRRLTPDEIKSEVGGKISVGSTGSAPPKPPSGGGADIINRVNALRNKARPDDKHSG